MKGSLIPLTVRRADVLHFLGYPEDREPPSRIGSLLDATLEEARELVEGRGLHVHLPLREAGDVGLEPIEALGLVLGLVTVGPALEHKVSEHLASGALTQGLILDAAGSAAVEEAADRLGADITGEPASGPVTCRLSPGYGRWGLEAQPALFSRLPHDTIGVQLSGDLVMHPHKSISFAMWLGASESLPVGVAGCDRCSLRTCRYRRGRRTAS